MGLQDPAHGGRALALLSMHALQAPPFQLEPFRFGRASRGPCLPGDAVNVPLDPDGTPTAPDHEWFVRSAYFQGLVENASDLITVLDGHGRILYQSPSVERVLGYTMAELSTHTVMDFVHPDDLVRVFDVMSIVLRVSGSSQSVECRMRHRDGDWREFECVGKSVETRSGRKHIVVNSRDATERRSMERELNASHERYRRFFDDDIAANLITSVEGRILACNPSFATMFGFESVEEALGTHVQRVYEDPALRDGIVQRLLEHGRIDRLEIELKRLDGQPVHVLANMVADRGPDGEIKQIRGYYYDETVVKQLESQLQVAHRLESLGLLAGGVAHDFNNLLTAILGHSQLAMRILEGHSQAMAHLQEISRASERAASLTRQLLAFSRREVGAPRAVILEHVVSDLTAMLRRLIGEHIMLTTELSCSPQSVCVDPGQLEQVVMNLVLNARDAMPGGGEVRIGSYREDVDEAFARGAGLTPGPHAVLVVSDNGMGMDAVTRSRIFEPFFTTRPVGSGTGLGLSIVYGVIRQCGGHISVDSAIGHGTQFLVHLPLHEGSLEAPRMGTPAPGQEGGNETILLVEDDDAVRALATEVLRVGGYRVIEATDGQHGLEIVSGLASDDLALIVSDIVMPRRSGHSFAALARQLRPNIRILFMSGYHEESPSELAGFAAGVPLLEKPFTPEELLTRVRQAIDGNDPSTS